MVFINDNNKCETCTVFDLFYTPHDDDDVLALDS